MMRPLPFLALALPLLSPALDAQTSSEAEQGMLRYPDVSAEHIVFVHANDLWVVGRSGGIALPLAAPQGAERAPKFSPDGRTIAFVGNYEGNTDLYTIAVEGGLPRRVTHHPDGEYLTDWAPDGRLYFSSSGFSGIRRAPKVFSVAPEGGLPIELPLPYGTNASLNQDGRRLAYTPNSRDNSNWKRYLGGMATDVWIFDLESRESTRVTDWEGTDSIPMWHGDRLYYLSDRGPAHRLNIWVYDPASGARHQVTRFTDFDVKWPSIGPGDAGQGEIVFQNGRGLYLLDLGTEAARRVDVHVPGARDSLRPREVDVTTFVRNANPSSTGKRVVVEARGDIWTLPAENGRPRNLTATDGVAERDPAWSPDGRWIAFFSDASGEYELHLVQSDGRGETRVLTKGSEGYRYAPYWSPTSEKIAFSDRSGTISVHDIESGETRAIAQHQAAEWGVALAWSHDGRWLTWSHFDGVAPTSSIRLWDSETGETHQVTSDMFSDDSPVFDRQGDFLYFVSQRNFRGMTGSDIDSTYIYRETDVILAVPLRDDVPDPRAPKSDEEEWKTDEDEGADDEGAEDPSDDEDASAGDEESTDDSSAAADDGVSGDWEGQVVVPGMGSMSFTMSLTLAGDTLSGDIFVSELGNAQLEGRFADGEASGTITTGDGEVHSFQGTLADGSLSFTVDTPEGAVTMSGTRTRAQSSGEGDAEEGDGSSKKGKKNEPAKRVEIDLDGFEARAIALPLSSGNFGNLRVNDKNQLLYARRGDGGGIKLYDLAADDPKETEVCSGGGFELSADGKQLMTMRGTTPAIGKAAAKSTPKNVVTDGLTAHIDPRHEWPQLFLETWRLYRDYFYADNLHGVDWVAIRDHYRPMIDACATRSDVDYVLRELVAELNCGHTYVSGGPLERGPSVGVGMLGCDFTLENGAYRIGRIYRGGTFDSDARGPLDRAGLDVQEGDYLLAVEGRPLDVAVDPWAAFVGLAGAEIELTVSSEPTLDDNARRVRVRTATNERGLRYRAWIEANRAHVLEASGGRIGYVYVPDTGRQGRSDFFRQFYGQSHLDALIVDERWNGGGQFPSREIEALNRPRTNYWARRWGTPWPTPRDSHQGPKCMLINRDSGSGGDMFPYLFKQAGLGKLIGTRTWGGLVGYSGSPSLIDGGTLAIPSFGFYELDGSWGVEGHGVDPDIEVIDDPALMQNGADPQLDVAIEHLLEELKTKAYEAPPVPARPDRSGMGLPEADKNQFPRRER